MDNQVDIVKCLEGAVDGCQKEIVTEHLFKDVLPSKECETPYILTSKEAHTEDLKSPGMESNTSKTSSLGGSPLKLTDYYVARNTLSSCKTGASYKPCTVNEARQLISAYQLRCQDEDISHPVLPLWVLCDQSDPQKTVAMSSVVKKIKADEFTFKSNVVTVSGPQNEKEVPSKLTTTLKKISHKANMNSQKVDVRCSATYNVFGALGSRDVSLDQIQTASSSMSLHLSWNKLSVSLSPPADAKALVRVAAVAGDERSAAYARHSELCILFKFIQGAEKNEVHWNSEPADVAPIERVTKMLDELKTGNTWSSATGGDGSDSPTPVSLSSNIRKDMDFTEQLWTILKDCTSNRELVECLKNILNCLMAGQIQPMVHRTNKTMLAELVRESFQHQMKPVNLEGAGAMNLLIDLGIEKITRDYIDTFVGKELVTLNHLAPFMTNNKNLTFAERADKLEKLHNTLELVVLLDQFIHVPHATLSWSARQGLEYYAENPTEPHHEFFIPVQTSVVTGYTENCKPCEYKVLFTSHYGELESHSIVHLSTQPLLSGQNPASLSETCNEEDQCSYYLTTVTQNVSSL